MVLLKGLTWDHPRGRAGLEATAEAYHRTHPEVEVRWETRTLHEFGDQPLDRVAGCYDMLIVDHPFAGFMARTGCVVPLDERMPKEFLDEQARNSVGPSFRSYAFANHQWALAVDAAAQVSAYRPDLMGFPPQTWVEMVRLLEDKLRRRVVTPLLPVDAISSFLTLCANLGSPVFKGQHAVDGRAGMQALRILRSLASGGHPDSLHLNPPRTLEMMAQTDAVVYSPLLYGYSNYSRDGFRDHVIKFANIPSSGAGPRGSNLVGAGLAISSTSKHVEECVEYAMYVADAETQRGIYFEAGGQPGHRGAWEDPSVNAASNGFFRDTLQTLEEAYLRPRHDGYELLQIEAGELIHSFLSEEKDATRTLDRLEALYQERRKTWGSG